MSQTTSWDRPQSPDRLGFAVTVIIALSIVAALCAIGFVLRADIANPSTASCISVTVLAPLLVAGRLMLGRRRRRRVREIRDARRGGISIGISRPRRERIISVDAARAAESGRHTGRRRLDLRPNPIPPDDEHDIMIMEV